MRDPGNEVAEYLQNWITERKYAISQSEGACTLLNSFDIKYLTSYDYDIKVTFNTSSLKLKRDEHYCHV